MTGRALITILPQVSQMGWRDGLRLPGTRRRVTETWTAHVQYDGFWAASANATEGSSIGVQLTMGRTAYTVAALAAAVIAIAPMQAAAAPAAGSCLQQRGSHRCLTLAVQKVVYRQLVHYQDTHPGQDEHAYVVIAKRWHLTLTQLRLLAARGSVQMWPLPPMP